MKPFWQAHTLKKSYDVVVVGAGVHGLAVAYYLAQRGVRRVAVLDRWYVGSGASGRNTAIVRANYRTVEGVRFYQESLTLYEGLAAELNLNLMFSPRGHLTLGHSDRSVIGLRERAEANKLLGGNSELIGPDRIQRLVPILNLHCHHPVLAALYHPPGGIIRHDAVVWGYAREAARRGVEIHPLTEVTGVRVEGGRVRGVESSRGAVEAPVVVNATAGHASALARMAGVDLPLVTHPLQAMVTEPHPPILDPVVVSAGYHVYISQTPRGEFVIGTEINEYASYSQRSTLSFLERAAAGILELFPCLTRVRAMRQWAGLSDMTPDYAPILGEAPQVKGFILDCGWGTWGFKAAPAAGKNIAALIDTGACPEVIRPFGVERFYNNALVPERAAAAVSH